MDHSNADGPNKSRPLMLLSTVARQVRKELDHGLETLGLSVPLLHALATAHAGEPLTISELARRCGVTPTAMYSTVGTLRLRGLATTRLADDGRSYLVIVTPSGRARLRRADEAVGALEQRAFRHLTLEQVEGLWVSLTLLSHTMQSD